MALHRFFVNDQVLAGETEPTFPLALTADDRRHAAVLRLEPGEHIAVIDGAGDYFECEVVLAEPELIVRIAGRKRRSQDPFSLMLCLGYPKGAVLDTVVRATTELGVDALLPFLATRSVARPDEQRGRKRVVRLQTIARNAAMQAGRTLVPEVSAPLGFDELLDRIAAIDALIVFWEQALPEATIESALDSVLASVASSQPNIGIVIGPEGGLTDEEVAALTSTTTPAAVASLGPTILRVETAAQSAVSLMRYELTRRKR